MSSGSGAAMVEAAVDVAKQQGGTSIIALLLGVSAMAWNVLDTQRTDYERFEQRMESLEEKVDVRVREIADEVRSMDKDTVSRDAKLHIMGGRVEDILSSVVDLGSQLKNSSRELELLRGDGRRMNWRINVIEANASLRSTAPQKPFLDDEEER